MRFRILLFSLIWLNLFSCGNVPQVTFSGLIKPINYRYRASIEYVELTNAGYKVYIPKLGDIGVPAFKKDLVVMVNVDDYVVQCVNIRELINQVKNLLEKDGYKFNNSADMLSFFLFKYNKKNAYKNRGFQPLFSLTSWIYGQGGVVLPVLAANGAKCFLHNNMLSNNSSLLYLDDDNEIAVCIDLFTNVNRRKMVEEVDFNSLSKEELNSIKIEKENMLKEREEILLNIKVAKDDSH
jgi:hypothetical protein